MMNAVVYGIRDAWSHKPIIWIAYVIQVLFGILVAILLTDLFKSSIYNSLNFETLLSGYDHTVISDFRNNHTDLIGGLMSTFSIMTIFFIPVSVYINGVLLHALIMKPKSIKSSVLHGFNTYLPFFLVMLVTLIGIMVWALITLFPLVNLIQRVFDATLSEPGLLTWYFIGGVAFYLGVVFILNWSITARTLFLRTKQSIRKCMVASFKAILSRPLQMIGTTSLIMILQILLIAVYLVVEDWKGMISPAWIIVFLVIQQIFVWVRILWRLMLYSAIDHLHTASPHQGDVTAID